MSWSAEAAALHALHPLLLVRLNQWLADLQHALSMRSENRHKNNTMLSAAIRYIDSQSRTK